SLSRISTASPRRNAVIAAPTVRGSPGRGTAAAPGAGIGTLLRSSKLTSLLRPSYGAPSLMPADSSRVRIIRRGTALPQRINVVPRVGLRDPGSAPQPVDGGEPAKHGDDRKQDPPLHQRASINASPSTRLPGGRRHGRGWADRPHRGDKGGQHGLGDRHV